jgi:hypothetical protein
MTKVLIRFQLQSPLTDAHLAQLAGLRGVYGLLHCEFDWEACTCAVEYDATRLRPAEVGALLRRHGIPVLPSQMLSIG